MNKNVIVEDAPKGVFLVTRYSETSDDRIEEIEGVDVLDCADIVKPFKVVHLFDDVKDNRVRYYTENEWNGLDFFGAYDRDADKQYHPSYITFQIFLEYLNRCIEFDPLNIIAENIMEGSVPFTFEDLPIAAQELVKYILDWDTAKPFEYKLATVVQSNIGTEESPNYYVHCFTRDPF